MAASKVPVQSKLPTVDDLLASVRKAHGASSIMRFSDWVPEPIDVIPSGALSLDLAIGVGGYPRGRIIEAFGPESSGKTTLALHAIAEAQKLGGLAAFVDAEHAFDVAYAKALGVDMDKLLFSQPDNGEEALNIVEELVDSGITALVVVDSVAALVPKAELEGEMGAHHVGVHARLMSQALRKLCGSTSKSGATLMFINQIRHKIGVMFGSPETTTGGNALKFYASVRLDVRRREQLKEGEEAVGNQMQVRVVKNKVAIPFQGAELEIRWGEGIDRVSDLLAVGILKDVIDKNGSWLSWKNERLGQGFNNAANALRSNPPLLAELDAVVRKAVGL